MRILLLTLMFAVSAVAQEKTPAPGKAPAGKAPAESKAPAAQTPATKAPAAKAPAAAPASSAQGKAPAPSKAPAAPAPAPQAAQEKAPAPKENTVPAGLPVQGPPPTNLTKFPDGHVSANAEPKNAENFEVRTVVAGDTLWGISTDVLKDGKLWPQIWEQNEHIVNPHWIYPKDKILIKPVTLITEAKPPAPPDQQPAAAPEPAPAPAQEPPVRRDPKPFIVPPYPSTEPPAGPKVILDLNPPRVYPEVKAADLYCSGFIRSADVPRDIKVVARYSNDEVMAGQGNYVYVGKGSADGVKPGAMYEVVRPTKRVSNLGTHYLEVGLVEIVSAQSSYSLARVSQGCEAIEMGDFLIPYVATQFPALPSNRPFSGTMKPSGQMPGRIVTTKAALLNSGSAYSHHTDVPSPGRSNMSKYDHGVASERGVVYLDLGSKDGVKAGDLFIVFRDVVTPDGSHIEDRETKSRAREAVAEVVVLKADERASTALVTYSADMISPGDSVERR